MSTLTQAQQDTLIAFIQADPVMNALPHTQDGASAIADLLVVEATPAFRVWKSDTLVVDIYNQLNWANYTPANPDAVLDANVIYTNRSLACQGKQFNLQTLLSGRDYLDTSKANVRAGLQDATTAIPSGANGATKSGGWTAIQLIIQRNANIIEHLFATGTGTEASPATMSFEGRLSSSELYEILGW